MQLALFHLLKIEGKYIEAYMQHPLYVLLKYKEELQGLYETSSISSAEEIREGHQGTSQPPRFLLFKI